MILHGFHFESPFSWLKPYVSGGQHDILLGLATPAVFGSPAAIPWSQRSPPPRRSQALLASALQSLGVSSGLQLQSFEAPMMQLVMKSDDSQAGENPVRSPWASFLLDEMGLGENN